MSGNADQRDFWTDHVGHIWVDQRAMMDAIFAPVLVGTLARAGLRHGHRVLDIGCGAGTSTLAAADIVGDAGHVTGVDISRTLLDNARSRATAHENVEFLEADAQTHAFAPHGVDAVVSRFGVMFFDDSIAAFRNIATALHPDGIISFAAWGAIEDNPFFTLPARIAREIFGPTPRSDPDAPGPFSLRAPDHIEAVLHAADFVARVDVVEETLICAQGAEALAQTMCLIGPAHSAINHHSADTAQRKKLIAALVDALAPYQTPAGTAMPAQINYARATKAPARKPS